LDLLAKESIILRDRQQLARHVEFLQQQLVTCSVGEGCCVSGDSVDVSRLTDTECDKLNVYITSHCLTGDILPTVSTDQQQQQQQQQQHR